MGVWTRLRIVESRDTDVRKRERVIGGTRRPKERTSNVGRSGAKPDIIARPSHRWDETASGSDSEGLRGDITIAGH